MRIDHDKEGTKMDASQSTQNWKRTYRFKPYFLVVNLFQAAAAVIFGCFLVWEESIKVKAWQGPVGDGLGGIALFCVAVFLVAECMSSTVILEQDTIAVHKFWGTRRLTKCEILGVKSIWRLGIAYTVLLPKRSTDKDLEIERSAYTFDEEWVRWSSSLPDLDKEHKLAVI